MDGAVLDDRTLRRVAALLVALAALAECAAGRAFPVRWFVLALMRCAERVARNVLVEASGWDPADINLALGIGSDLGDPPGSGTTPADAVALGWRLRAIAALFGALLPPDGPPGRAETRSVDAPRRLAAQLPLLVAMPCGCARPAPDTS